MEKKHFVIFAAIILVSAVITLVIQKVKKDEDALVTEIMECVASSDYQAAEEAALKLVESSSDKTFPTTILASVYAAQDKYQKVDEVMSNLAGRGTTDEERGLAYGYWAAIYADRIAGFDLKKQHVKFAQIGSEAIRTVRSIEMCNAIAQLAPYSILDELKLPDEESADLIEKLLIECIKTAPESSFVHYSIASFYSDGRLNHKKALEHLNQAINIEPDNKSYMFAIGLEHLFMGDGAKAAELFKKIQNLAANEEDAIDEGAILFNLAFASVVDEKPAEALAYCKKAKAWYQKETPGNYTIIRWLEGAINAAQAGDTAAAEANIQRFVKEWSCAPEIEQEIINLLKTGLKLK